MPKMKGEVHEIALELNAMVDAWPLSSTVYALARRYEGSNEGAPETGLRIDAQHDRRVGGSGRAQRCLARHDPASCAARGIRVSVPVRWPDAIVIKVRDAQVANGPVYVAVAVNLDGERDVLGLWLGSARPVGWLHCQRVR